MELSVHLDNNILHKAENELENLYAIIDGYNALQAIQQIKSDADQQTPFWREIVASLMDQFTINWCKLFGIDCNDSYWKQTTQEQKGFRDLVYANTGFDHQSLNEYRHAMHEFRNELVQHMTPYHKVSRDLDLNPAFQVAAACHSWLHELLNHFSISAEGPVNTPDYPVRSLKEALEEIKR